MQKAKDERSRRLAILYDENEKFSPSNPEAIFYFIKVARELNFYVELINLCDIKKLKEFDALFIRQTTSLLNSVHEFSLKAQKLGLVVIDDPQSIEICCDKARQYILYRINEIPIPETYILDDFYGASEILEKLEPPYIIKNPYESFSTGVYLTYNKSSCRQFIVALLKKVDKLIIQEFIKTDFDWRIGILNNEIIFACKYFMTKDNWKIIKHDRNGNYVDGESCCVSINDVPPLVAAAALKTASVIGKGFYGIDIKQTAGGKVYVIEANDNPNVDHEIEDQLEGENIYRKIISNFHLQLDEQARLRAALE